MQMVGTGIHTDVLDASGVRIAITLEPRYSSDVVDYEQ